MERLLQRMSLMVLLLCAGGVAICGIVRAAEPATKPKKTAKEAGSDGSNMAENIRIRKITGVAPAGLVKTPEYTVRNVARGATAPQDWGQILVEFETKPKWIDQLTFNYYVLLLTSEKDVTETKYTLMEGMIVCIDIEKDSNHKNVAYLRPSTIERYGDIVACAVVISDGTETVEKDETSGRANVKGKWWTALRNDPKITVKSGYVLNMLQTPFAFANYDDYDAIQQ